jgi:hypothetical protein
MQGKNRHLLEIKLMPKKPNPSQKPTQQKKGGAPKKGTQAGKKDTTQAPQEQEKEVETAQGTTSSATQQEQGQTKRPIIHTGGACKKAKVHKTPPEYTIMRMMQTSWLKESTTGKLRTLKMPNTKGTRFRMSWPT